MARYSVAHVKRIALTLGALLGVLGTARVARPDTAVNDPFTGVFKIVVTPDSSATLQGRQTFTEYVQFEAGHFLPPRRVRNWGSRRPCIQRQATRASRVST